MKRLKNFLLGMQVNTTTYREMYEGEILITDPQAPDMEPIIDYDPVYYREDIGFEIALTHKLAQSKPTIKIMIPADKLGISEYTPFAADFCLREFKPYIDSLNRDLYNRSRPDSENGRYYLDCFGCEVLVRNTSYFAVCHQKGYEHIGAIKVRLLCGDRAPEPKMCLCIRLQVQLPEKKIRKATQMLCRDLPDAVDMFLAEFDTVKLNKALNLAEKQKAIREYLKTSHYCAFIANGSILPRLKNTNLPMPDAVPFCSAPEDEIEICGVKGMGIKKGVTVITGGGYSGKSTLLNAISAGIYDHCLGDGRELCITDETAVTISAEDGRSIKKVNISPFIKWVPNGDPKNFSTEHASGSTSQAANIMEAVDCGAKLLLIDEDRSAANFMIRDRIMKELIEKDPITPFTDRVNELYSRCGVSAILVIGGSSEFIPAADKVYMMEDYLINDVTEKSKAICFTHKIKNDSIQYADWEQKRILSAAHFTSYPEGCGSERLEVSDMGFIIIGDETVDIRGLLNIASKHQLDALGYMLRRIELNKAGDVVEIDALIDDMYGEIERNGLDTVYSGFFTTTERFLELPRKAELKAVINRMRKNIWKKSVDER